MMGLYLSYSEHRPFTISPDMIWLLILQGVTNHINFSYENRSSLFPDLNQKQTLFVKNPAIKIRDPNSPWDETTVEFSKSIEKILGTDLIKLLRANFSTTGEAEKVASEITILDAMKPYFEYIVYYAICGIPEITLEGKPSDWDNMLNKLNGLRKHQLDWWVDELIPIISQIRKSAVGNPDKEFWMNIFKIHTEEGYGHPKRVDGWITKFFPYNRSGERIDLTKMRVINIDKLFKELPKEIVAVPFEHWVVDHFGKPLVKTKLEYWSGFMGVSQDHKTFGLRPEINWFIGHASSAIENQGTEDKSYGNSRVFYNLEAFPNDVLAEKQWDELVLKFKGQILIPDKITDLEIGLLSLHGTSEAALIEKIKNLFNQSGTEVEINGETIVNAH